MKTPSGATIAVFALYSAARSKRGKFKERRLLRWMGRSADTYWHRRAFVKVAATAPARRHAHSIKGASANVCAESLREIAGEIELVRQEMLASR